MAVAPVVKPKEDVTRVGGGAKNPAWPDEVNIPR